MQMKRLPFRFNDLGDGLANPPRRTPSCSPLANFMQRA